MEAYQKRLTGHALILLIIGLLAGFMLAFSLIGGLEVVPTLFIGIPTFGTTEGWVRAHSGGIMNGLMLIAFAFIMPHCGLAAERLQLFAKGIIFAGWANTIFYWTGNASGSRALSFSDNALGRVEHPRCHRLYAGRHRRLGDDLHCRPNGARIFGEGLSAHLRTDIPAA
jgi:hypothetical protein